MKGYLSVVLKRCTTCLWGNNLPFCTDSLRTASYLNIHINNDPRPQKKLYFKIYDKCVYFNFPFVNLTFSMLQYSQQFTCLMQLGNFNVFTLLYDLDVDQCVLLLIWMIIFPQINKIIKYYIAFVQTDAVSK